MLSSWWWSCTLADIPGFYRDWVDVYPPWGCLFGMSGFCVARVDVWEELEQGNESEGR
jgi:hypothetical protein